MCGRYSLVNERKKVEALLAAELPEPLAPDYNIGPGRQIVALSASAESGPRAELLHWGLHRPKNFLINARLETANELETFSNSWAARRCAVPASGFYEWHRDEDGKTPYYFQVSDQPLFLFAGLWFPPSKERPSPSCVLLTTAANESMARVHHRMPVILSPDAREPWLERKLSKGALTEQAAAVQLTGYPVSSRVNSVRNNDSELIREVEEPRGDQLSLF